MFGLAYGCYQHFFAAREFGFLVLGLQGSGKTCLLERLKSLYGGVVGLPPDKVVSTVGCNVARLTLPRCKALVWDLGGRASLRSIWEKYFGDCRALVYCVDAADVVHWNEARQVLKELLLDARLAGVPVLVFASKADIPGAKHADELASFFDLRELGEAVARRCHFHSASFVDTAAGVAEGLAWLEQRLVEGPPVN